MDKDLINSEVNGILEGAGWTTGDYVLNFSPGTTKEKYQIILELAKRGRLYDEEQVEEDNDGSKPKKGKQTVAMVEKEWKTLNK